MFKDEFEERWSKDSTFRYVTDSTAYADVAADMVRHSLIRQYVGLEDESNPILRLSGLGKYSIVELLAKKFGIIEQGGDRTVSEQCRFRFSVGDIFEAQMYFLLQHWGFQVIETQKTITWNGVSGHTDFIVLTPGGETCLVELKTANDFYFKQVKKWIGDERGYLTQLLCYNDVTKLPAYWLFYNKDTSEMMVKPLDSVPEDVRKQRLERAAKLVKIFNDCESFDDYPLFCCPPPPKIEKLKDGTHKYWEDGSLRLYIGDYDISHPELFYILDRKKNDYGKMRNYVVDFNYPEKHLDKKPDIQQLALQFDGRQ